MQNRLCRGKAITHLLRPTLRARPDALNKTSLLDLGKSLVLVANIAGIAGIIDDVRTSVGRHSNINQDDLDESVLVSRIDGGTQAVAPGAAHAVMKFLFANRAFPIARVLGPSDAILLDSSRQWV